MHWTSLYNRNPTAPLIQKPTWHQLPLYMDPLLLVANTGYLFKLVHLQTPGADIWWLLKHITRIVSKRMVRILLEFFLVTVRNSSCGKVMFSQVSVCPRGEGCTPSCQADINPPRQTHPPSPPPPQMATAADGTHPTGMHSC